MKHRILLLYVLVALAACSAPTGKRTTQVQRDEDPHRRHHAERKHDFDVIHYSYELAVDRTPHQTRGTAEISFSSTVPELNVLALDASQMKIISVTNSKGAHLKFQHREPTLQITLLETMSRGERSAVNIRWEGMPRQGMFWVLPDKHYPDKPFQIWTQGEPEYTHYWLPCYDSPNDKATTEMKIVVPSKYYALSNGVLLSRKEKDGWTTFHWKEDIPYSPYLLTCVVGEFDIYTETFTTDKGEIPLDYIVPAGKFTKEEVLWSFGKTGQMMQFFGDNIGFPYPYGKYAQVAVWDFSWGGMENVTATTMYEGVVTKKPLWDDRNSEGLIAHELVHQWFGDWLTTQTWEHIWLNEGFASYFTALWKGHHLGEDDLAWEMEGGRGWHLGELSTKSRPVATDFYSDPDDLFDSFIYAKGAWVLHMLRDVVGDNAWWKGIRSYVERHRAQNVVTADFQKVMEEAYGKPLDWFFDQWVRGEGIPSFRVEKNWDAEHRTLRVTIEQIQEGNLFQVPIEMEVMTEAKSSVYRILSQNRKQDYYFVLESPPFMVRFDREGKVLKKVDFKKSLGEWMYQMKSGTHALTRVRAVQELGLLGDSKKKVDRFGLLSGSDEINAVLALKSVLLMDRHIWVRIEAAKSLGKIEINASRDALAEGVGGNPDPRVRREVLSALDHWAGEPEIQNLLRRQVEEDKSWTCQENAATALGKVGKEILPFLLEQLEKQADKDCVVQGLLSGLGQIQDERVLPLLTGHAAYGKARYIRLTAISQIAIWGKEREDRTDPRTFLVKLLDDKDGRVISSVIHALEKLEDREAISNLKSFARRTTEARYANRALRAARKLESLE